MEWKREWRKRWGRGGGCGEIERKEGRGAGKDGGCGEGEKIRGVEKRAWGVDVGKKGRE